ncbi:nitroreductase family protein [Anaerophilus nitritogenes]|uniref:nitroreductase family protein n=1 Tax=Anaerophilus nitritogenes TaxID=2498136 RepID=UPI00101C31F1|nr:nitroreductase family protein [Anaerophilus nitritogenes]
MSNLDFIYKRKSVRKFKEQDVPMEDIKEMLKAATYAPSGKNVQNWHYVIVKDKNKIEQIAQAIENVYDRIIEKVNDPEKTKGLTKFLKYYTVFREAPVLIMAYMGHYEEKEIELLEEIGMYDQANVVKRTASRVQNVAASLENFMLAAANMGYGTCWMTGACFATLEIETLIPMEKEGFDLMAISPLGIPLKDSTAPKRKEVEEIFTLIE